MNESTGKRGIIVGIFIIIGLLFLVGGILAIGDLHSTFQRKMTVSTVFNDVDGLIDGNNIWFSGLKIGTVKKLEFYGKSQVKVILNINLESKQYIKKDAKVKVGTDGLIGNKILVIYGGSSSAKEIEEGDTLSNEAALSTENIMSTFQQNNLNVLAITKKLASGEGTIGKLLSDDSIYKSISATAKSLQATAVNAKTLTASFENFSGKLNKNGTLLNNLITDTTVFNSLRHSVLQLHHVADTASVIANNLKAASSNTKTPAGILLHDEQTGANLKATINNMESGSKKLDSDLEGLQHSFLLRKYFKKKKEK